jgi:AcrR family transcriptional regulator
VARKRLGKEDLASITTLEAEDWIRSALTTLAREGIEAVRVEPLAKGLGITKGSFYWHFKDRAALLDSVLNYWRRRATFDIIARLENTKESAETRLVALLKLPFYGARSSQGADVELAIRLWSRNDPRAYQTLEEIDRLRLRYIVSLLQEMGYSDYEAGLKSIHCYAFMRVAGSLLDHEDSEQISDCVAALLKQ